MDVIILAAGYGTRLYPLTKDKPKALIPVAGKPILEHILFRIEEINGVKKIVIVSNNVFYQNFVEWKKSYKANVEIKILNDGTSTNETRLGAIGDINFAITKENLDDDLMVVGSDNIFDFGLVHLHKFFHEKKSSVVALYDIVEKSKASNKYGVVITDENLRILDFHEKPSEPKSSLVSTACYIISKKDVEIFEHFIRDNPKIDNLGEFIKFLSAKKHVYGFVFSERWFDIGSHEQLKEAHEYWSNKIKS